MSHADDSLTLVMKWEGAWPIRNPTKAAEGSGSVTGLESVMVADL